MSDDFYEVAIPEPTTILGLRLKPFSLGHIILLHRVKSGFVIPEEKVGFDDLALSVLLCSLSYADGCALFNNTDLPRFFSRWHQKLSRTTWSDRLMRRKPVAIDYVAKIDAFRKYIADGSKMPDYSYTPGDFQSQHCPSVQIVKVALMRDMHFSEAELMDRPWSLCLWDYVTLKAISGQVRMVDTDAIREAQGVADRIMQRIQEGKCRF